MGKIGTLVAVLAYYIHPALFSCGPSGPTVHTLGISDSCRPVNYNGSLLGDAGMAPGLMCCRMLAI